MNGSYKQAIALQGRVLWALSLREIQGKHGKSRLGYIWQIIKTGFNVGVFWGIRAFSNVPSPESIPLPIFLLMGFVPWFIFSQCVTLALEAVRTNKSLLTFPQITPLDLILASCLVAWVTEAIVLIIYMSAIVMLGYHVTLHDPISFGASFLGIGFFGLGVGLVLNAIAVYLPVMEKLVPMVMRVLFFSSGLFFSPLAVGGELGRILMWNPVSNIIELMRGAFIYTTPSPLIKVNYVICLTIGILTIGLLLERFVRSKQELV